ncbi:hypothetical protein GCM10007977_025970 [Dactylosporangium sucinum]|uniref:Uncharacterized protein n=2 Tax=Dactylosporangium sucinum TaxID=1424081 RepID=A0A917THI0_9ACTN|nr:hypothetical protein GCM10007977_025970 [Dactylosporangium sucinum]
MADGARLVGQSGSTYELSVSMPNDADGFFGRQCPACRRLFRMQGDDYDALPDDLQLWCVYCGHHDDRADFRTEQQDARAMRAVDDVGEQIVDQLLDRALGGRTRRRPRSSSGGRAGLRLSITVTARRPAFRPKPLPAIQEEQLIRIRQCQSGGCGVRYAVFGEHRFCPVCGPLPAAVVARDALAAETTRLDALAQLPTEAAAALREQGGLTRLWVDTIENLVGVVETLAKTTFFALVTDAAQRVQGKGNVFQRLDDTATLFVDAGHPDLRDTVGVAVWQRLQQVWAARHVFTHNDGVVDARYLTRVPSSTARAGQRLTITEADCRQAIADTERLCAALATIGV